MKLQSELIKAKQTMIGFAKSRNGKIVYFDLLSTDEKTVYVMIDSFQYFGFLPQKERITRAIKNAKVHADREFLAYAGHVMTIAE